MSEEEPSRPSEEDGVVTPKKSTVPPTSTATTAAAAAKPTRHPRGFPGGLRGRGGRWHGGRRMSEEEPTLSVEDEDISVEGEETSVGEEESTSVEDTDEGTQEVSDLGDTPSEEEGTVGPVKAKKKKAAKKKTTAKKKAPAKKATAAKPKKKAAKKKTNAAAQPTTAAQTTTRAAAKRRPFRLGLRGRAPGGQRGRGGRDGASNGGFLQPPHRRHLAGPEEWGASAADPSSSSAVLLAGIALVVGALLYVYKKSYKTRSSLPTIEEDHLEDAADDIAGGL